MALKVYIASAYENKELVASYMRRLEAEGVIITYDWTEEEAPLRGELGLPTLDQRRISHAELDAVAEADLVWLISPDIRGTGCFIEVGCAYGHGIEVMWSGPRRTIFCSLATYYYPIHERAFEVIIGMAHHQNRLQTTLDLSVENE